MKKYLTQLVNNKVIRTPQSKPIRVAIKFRTLLAAIHGQ